MPKTPRHLTNRVNFACTENEHQVLVTRAAGHDRSINEEIRRAVDGQAYLDAAIGPARDMSKLALLSPYEAQLIVHSLGYVTGVDSPSLPDPNLAKAALVAMQSFR